MCVFFFSQDDIVDKRNWERVFSTNSFGVTFDAVPSWFERLKIVAEAVRCCLFIVRRTCTLMLPTPTLYFYSSFFLFSISERFFKQHITQMAPWEDVAVSEVVVSGRFKTTGSFQPVNQSRKVVNRLVEVPPI